MASGPIESNRAGFHAAVRWVYYLVFLVRNPEPWHKSERPVQRWVRVGAAFPTFSRRRRARRLLSGTGNSPPNGLGALLATPRSDLLRDIRHKHHEFVHSSLMLPRSEEH